MQEIGRSDSSEGRRAPERLQKLPLSKGARKGGEQGRSYSFKPTGERQDRFPPDWLLPSPGKQGPWRHLVTLAACLSTWLTMPGPPPEPGSAPRQREACAGGPFGLSHGREEDPPEPVEVLEPALAWPRLRCSHPQGLAVSRVRPHRCHVFRGSSCWC